jgi:hypothetical protein
MMMMMICSLKQQEGEEEEQEPAENVKQKPTSEEAYLASFKREREREYGFL